MTITEQAVASLPMPVKFQDRNAMREGHPTRRFKLPTGYTTLLPTGWPQPNLPLEWYKGLSFPMLGNDRYGICMLAAAAHGQGSFTGNNGPEWIPVLDKLIQQYLALSGGDNGLNEGDLIHGWKAGVAYEADQNIVDALDIDITDYETSQAAVQLFGGILFMLAVPNSWLNSGNGSVWDAPARPNPRNGHGVYLNGVDGNGNYHLLTWGGYRILTQAGAECCDPGAFITFAPKWFAANGYAPNGIHITQLAALWRAAGGHKIPATIVDSYPAPTPTPPGPGPTPVPTPPQWWVVIQELIAEIRAWLASIFGSTKMRTTGNEQAFRAAFAKYGIESDLAIANWILIIIQALEKKAPEIVAVVIADIAAGKTLPQILEDVLAVLFKTS